MLPKDLLFPSQNLFQSAPLLRHQPPVPGQPVPPLSNPLGLLAEASGAAKFVNESQQPENYANNVQHLLHQSLQNDGPLDSNIAALGFPAEAVITGLGSLSEVSVPKVSESASHYQPLPTVRDLDFELDPLGLCLLSEQQVQPFFAAFFNHLHPLIAILDPNIHVSTQITPENAVC